MQRWHGLPNGKVTRAHWGNVFTRTFDLICPFSHANLTNVAEWYSDFKLPPNDNGGSHPSTDVQRKPRRKYVATGEARSHCVTCGASKYEAALHTQLVHLFHRPSEDDGNESWARSWVRSWVRSPMPFSPQRFRPDSTDNYK